MRQHHLTTLMAISMIVALAPTSIAATTVSDTITPTASAYAVKGGHIYEMSLAAGDVVEIELTWTDTQADLDVLLLAPGGRCNIFDTSCIEALVESRVMCADGVGPGDTVAPGGGVESFTVTAQTTATHEIFVAHVFGVPFQPVPYTLTVSVNGGSPALSGPTNLLAGVDTGTHCRMLDLAGLP